MQCVNSATDEKYGPVSANFRNPDFTHTAFSEVLPVPDVITVIRVSDDGWSYHPKQVEQFTEI
jgi:hypothetical protein